VKTRYKVTVKQIPKKKNEKLLELAYTNYEDTVLSSKNQEKSSSPKLIDLAECLLLCNRSDAQIL
jgi:hypothetical protein